MIRRNTWIALAVFALVASFAYLLIRSRAERPAVEPTPAPDPLWLVSSSEIVSLTLEEPAADRLVQIERHAEQLWRTITPENGEVEVAGVERAVSWLSSPSPRSRLTKDQDLSVYQLDPPQFRIELRLASGTEYSLLVGRETPTGGSRYVSMPESDEVWIVSSLGLDEVLGLISAP